MVKWLKVASGNWENNAKEKTVNFDAIETDKVEFKVLAGAAGFGSAAEIQLLKPVSTNKVEEPVSPETCDTRKTWNSRKTCDQKT